MTHRSTTTDTIDSSSSSGLCVCWGL